MGHRRMHITAVAAALSLFMDDTAIIKLPAKAVVKPGNARGYPPVHRMGYARAAVQHCSWPARCRSCGRAPEKRPEGRGQNLFVGSQRASTILAWKLVRLRNRAMQRHQRFAGLHGEFRTGAVVQDATAGARCQRVR
eukprot:4782010-Amphidinium_carterae.1